MDKNIKELFTKIYHRINVQFGKLIFRTPYPPATQELKIFIDLINKKYQKLNISILNMGARGGLSFPYIKLEKIKNLYLEGIEPDKQEALAILKSKQNRYNKVHPFALSDKVQYKELYITRGIGCTSLLEPNLEELRYYTFSPRFEVIKKIKFPVTTLNKLYSKEERFDFICMDVQGSEYDIINGGKMIFKNALAISFESHFFEYYKKQKLFPDLHKLCLKNGFRLIRLDLRSHDGAIGEASNCVYIKKHTLIKNKREFLKQILFSLLWDKKEYVEFLLRNCADKFLSDMEKKDIINRLKIILKKKESPLKFAYDGIAAKDYPEGKGYLN